MFAGLVGAIAWNLITWYFGLPSSSSRADRGHGGGRAGGRWAKRGFVRGGVLGKVMIPAIVAPILAFVVAGAAILVLYRIVGRLHPRRSRAAFASAR